MDQGFKAFRVDEFDERLRPLRADDVKKDLVAARLGEKIHYFRELDSTNLHAYKLAREGAAEGEIVAAEAQSRGKGRLGRSWVSPPFRNLYLSVILRPALAPAHAPQITLMTAVALADTVRSFISQSPGIKWPNDIVVAGRKLAGILTEAACERDRIEFVVVGIGVNLNYPTELMPESIRHTATSIMSLAGRAVDREAFARRLIQSLDQCYGSLAVEGFPPIAARWESYFYLRGKRVRVDGVDGSVLGRAVGIDRDGALLLADDQGKAQRILAGDVIPLEADGQ